MINVPATSQSLIETASCPHGYGRQVIQGDKSPDTEPSVRGLEVHEVAASYGRHCARRKVPADFSFFNSLLLDTGEEATQILENWRDNLTIDYENFYDAEVTLGLDEDFAPTYPVDRSGKQLAVANGWDVAPSGKPCAYVSTLDVVYLMNGGLAARVPDYKTHPQPFLPVTFQSKLYPLQLFMHMPHLVEVEFVLVFARYPNIFRPIKFTREDVPALKDAVKRARERQKGYHATFAEQGIDGLKAIGGTHCGYCPAASDLTCPILKLNPILQLTGEERLQWELVVRAARRVNNTAMKQMVQATGQNITTADANGRPYWFGPEEGEEITYPLFVEDGGGGFISPIIDALADWALEAPEDVLPSKRSPVPWMAKLKIGATELHQYIKAKKREVIHNRIRDLARVKDVVSMTVQHDASTPEKGGGREDIDGYKPENEWEV